MAIRDFEFSDREIYRKLAGEFYDTPAVLHPIDEKTFDITFDECISDSPFSRGLIIECDGEIAGYALLSFTYSSEVAGMVVLIEELYIRSYCQGKGLGSELFAWLEYAYRDAKRFRLEISPDNERAKQLYKRVGFSVLPYVQMTRDFD